MVLTGMPVPTRLGVRPSDFRPDIEGMRAVAVTLVVVFHAGAGWLPGGFIGVDVFFVISGFLITRLLLAEVLREGRLFLPDFWARRARRLLPASALVLVVVGAVSLLLVDPLERIETGRDVTAASAFVANWWFAHTSLDYFAADRSMSPVLHFWSLSVEEQYYLVWPPLLALLVWWVRRRDWSGARLLRLAAALLVAAGAVSFVWSLYETTTTPVRAYYGTPARAWELALGGLVAVLTMSGARLPMRLAAPVAGIGLIAIGVAALTISEATPFPGVAALAPTVGTAAVLMAGATPGSPGPLRLLGARVPREIGRLSYSWYLWHWPFLVLAPVLLGVAELDGTQTVAVVLASLAVAWLTFLLVEDPVRRSAGLSAAPGRSLALGGMLIAAGLVAGQVAVRAPPAGLGGVSSDPVGGDWLGGSDVPGSASKGQGSAVAIRPDPLLAREDTNRIRADRCQSLFDWTEVKQCVYGIPGSDRRWVLWGDSHAVQWFPALEANALEAGVALQVFGKTSCPPALVQFYSRKWDRPYSECTTWRDEVLRQVLQMPPGTVVFLSGMNEYAVEAAGRPLDDQQSAPLVAQGAREVARQLTQRGLTVVSLRDTPFPPFEVPACVAANLSDPSRCDFERPAEDRGTSWEQRVLGDIPGVQSVDLLDEVCGPRICPAVVDGILRWRDADHLTATFAETLAKPLRVHLEELGLMPDQVDNDRTAPVSP